MTRISCYYEVIRSQKLDQIWGTNAELFDISEKDETLFRSNLEFTPFRDHELLKNILERDFFLKFIRIYQILSGYWNLSKNVVNLRNFKYI